MVYTPSSGCGETGDQVESQEKRKEGEEEEEEEEKEEQDEDKEGFLVNSCWILLQRSYKGSKDACYSKQTRV